MTAQPPALEEITSMGETFDIGALAEGLWLRMRDVVLAERRLERFTFAPESPEAAVASPLSAVARDPQALSDLARDVALRALAAAADGLNDRILSGLGTEGTVALEELARRVGLPRLALAERLGALAQAGLVARDLERQSALLTAAGRAMLGLVEALGGALGGRLHRGLPALLSS